MTNCILHDPDPRKPAETFISEVQSTIDRQTPVADLSSLHWYEISFESIRWHSAVSLVGSHFHGVTPFGAAKFGGDVDLASCNFDGVLQGKPEFAGNLSLRDSKFDGIKWEDAIVRGTCDLRRVQFWSDSFITRCAFQKDLDLSGSKIWELHFSGCRFESALTFQGATGRISFRWFQKTPSRIDISGMKLQGSDLSLPKFKGSLLASRTDFEGSVDLSDAELDLLDFSQALFRKDLNLARSTVKSHCLLAGAVCDGAVDLTGLDVAAGLLDISNMSIARPEGLRLVRVNRRRGSPPLRVRIGTSNIDGARIDDVQWNRDGGRVQLEDEQAVSGGGLTPAQAALTYRRLRKSLEASHWYEEADDCLSAAMEMRSRDASAGLLARVFSVVYKASSFYGSSYRRAAAVLAALVLLFLAPAFALAGLAYGAYRPQGMTEGEYEETGNVPGPVRGGDSIAWAIRSYGRGLVHTLETGTLRDSTSFRPVTAFGVTLESAARILVPAQFAALLLTLRRRFVRT